MKMIHICLGAGLGVAVFIGAYGTWRSLRAPAPQAPLVTAPSPSTAAATSQSALATRTDALPRAAPATYAPAAEVVLASPGQAPRKQVRYIFAEGQRRRIDIVTTRRSELEMGGRSVVVPGAESGELELAVLTRVSKTGSDGGAERTTSFEHVALRTPNEGDSRFQTAAASVAKRIQDSTFADLIDSQGQVRTGQFAAPVDGAPATLNDSNASTFRLFGVPFPKEPIGLRARWTAKSEVKVMGVSLMQTVSYELVEIGNGKGRVKQTSNQLASPGMLQAPKQMAAMKAELVAMTSSGRGELSFELEGGQVTGRVETTTLLALRASRGAKPTTSTLKLHVAAEATSLAP